MKQAIIMTLAAFDAGGLAAFKLIPAAYSFRGYHAIGGEWLLIILAAALAAWLAGKLARV